MRRKVIPLAVLLAAFGGGTAASAQSAQEQTNIAVTGSVGRMCILASPQIDLGTATNIGAVSGATVRIAELSNDQMTTRGTRFTAQLAAMCNMSHQVTVSSDRGGLWRDPAGVTATGFASGIPYRATISWGGAQTTLNATAASEASLESTLTIDTPSNGDVTIDFRIDPAATNTGTGTPLIAGSYDDTIRVTMGPQ